MSESNRVEERVRERSEGLIEEDKEDDNDMSEVERHSEDSGGIHEDLIDAVARGTEDTEVLREQDRFLPICNIARVMRRMVPESGKMSKESKEAVQEAVSEFISFITSEASDKCIEEQRKTITCDDLLNAIEAMGFDKYVEPLKLFLKRYREATRSDRPHGEIGEDRSPSPSRPIPIPPSSFPHSASGPGGHIQPAPTTSISSSIPSTLPSSLPSSIPSSTASSIPPTTALLQTPQGSIRISLPPGYSLGEKGGIVYKGVQKVVNGQQNVRLTGGDVRTNGDTHGQSHIQPKQPQGPSTSSQSQSEGPITIFIDQTTGQRYRSVVGQDGTQRLAPVKMMKRPQPSSRSHPSLPPSSLPSSSLPPPPPPPSHRLTSPQSIPSSSSISVHQSPQISSTTPQIPSSQSRFHLQSNNSSYSVQSHHSSNSSSQYHHSQHNPISYHNSSSSNHNSSMPPPQVPLPRPPTSSSTNYIQLMPHSTLPTTPVTQYTHYQGERLASVEDGSNGRREEKRQMTASIANTKWNASSGQYVVDVSKVGGELTSKRRRPNNKGQ